MEKIKKCFCGSRAVLKTDTSGLTVDDKPFYYVQCSNTLCGCRLSVNYNKEEDAIKHWNNIKMDAEEKLNTLKADLETEIERLEQDAIDDTTEENKIATFTSLECYSRVLNQINN